MTGMAFSYDENGKATKVPVPEDSVIEEMTSAFMEAVATTDDALMENSSRVRNSPRRKY